MWGPSPLVAQWSKPSSTKASNQKANGSCSNWCLLTVLTWLTERASTAAVEGHIDRLCRNFRIDKRVDYPHTTAAVFSSASPPDAANALLERVCASVRKLKLVVDAVDISTRPAADPVPKFLFPTRVNLQVPAFGSVAIDEAKLQQVFAQLLYGLLLRIWSPLRYAEELIAHLNAYCAQLPSLARDDSASPPSDASLASRAVVEQLKRLDSNLSRIEGEDFACVYLCIRDLTWALLAVFVLMKHNLPSNGVINDLLQLKSDLMLGVLTEDTYRTRKDAVLDALVEYNLIKFRPTPFFLLVSPPDTSRASIAPRVVHERTLEAVVSDSFKQQQQQQQQKEQDEKDALDKANVADASPSHVRTELRSDVSIDELMALTIAPLTRTKTPSTPLSVSKQQRATVVSFHTHYFVCFCVFVAPL